MEVDHPSLGLYRFFRLALRPGHFLDAVDRHTLAGQAALVAQPLQALLDLVCLRKLESASVRALTQSMRIDADPLMQTDPDTWEALQRV